MGWLRSGLGTISHVLIPFFFSEKYDHHPKTNKKRTVQPGAAFEDTAIQQRFEIVEF